MFAEIEGMLNKFPAQNNMISFLAEIWTRPDFLTKFDFWDDSKAFNNYFLKCEKSEKLKESEQLKELERLQKSKNPKDLQKLQALEDWKKSRDLQIEISLRNKNSGKIVLRDFLLKLKEGINDLSEEALKKGVTWVSLLEDDLKPKASEPEYFQRHYNQLKKLYEMIDHVLLFFPPTQVKSILVLNQLKEAIRKVKNDPNLFHVQHQLDAKEDLSKISMADKDENIEDALFPEDEDYDDDVNNDVEVDLSTVPMADEDEDIDDALLSEDEDCDDVTRGIVDTRPLVTSGSSAPHQLETKNHQSIIDVNDEKNLKDDGSASSSPIAIKPLVTLSSAMQDQLEIKTAEVLAPRVINRNKDVAVNPILKSNANKLKLAIGIVATILGAAVLVATALYTIPTLALVGGGYLVAMGLGCLFDLAVIKLRQLLSSNNTVIETPSEQPQLQNTENVPHGNNAAQAMRQNIRPAVQESNRSAVQNNNSSTVSVLSHSPRSTSLPPSPGKMGLFSQGHGNARPASHPNQQVAAGSRPK